jgi:hypothetical protein
MKSWYAPWPEELEENALRPSLPGLLADPRVSAQTDMIHRLAGGGQSGRASAAEKALEAIKGEGTLVAKPFVPKKRK